MSWRVGVDIGGTFTDFYLLDTTTGQVRIHKTLTTPAAPEQAVVEGLARLLAALEVAASAVGLLAHGTTLATNALIEGRGARVGVVTTAGFRDVLIMGRQHRYDMQDLLIDLPRPPVRRADIVEVPERVDASGRVLRPLEPDAVRKAARDLLGRGIASLAVCFLHSYKEPAHERQAASVLRGELGLPYVSVSHEVAPVIREYERFTTTVINAYVQPLIDRYLTLLGERVRALGITVPLTIMLNNGGLALADDVRLYPVRLLESGPAAGVMAAASLASVLGERAVLSFDMGGTTAKGAIVLDGAAPVTPELEVARLERFKPGSGSPIAVPAIELVEVGAGGGSIAFVDAVGRLRVGPASAGADPGPACYGRGGSEPTVTDADLLLGYLNPGLFAAGQFELDAAAAERAVASLAQQLGLSVEAAAWGIYTVVNQNMAQAFRIHALERGVDIRRCTMVAFGGAGPVHATGLAEALGIKRVVVPRTGSVFSAQGLVETPPSFEQMRTFMVRLDQADWGAVRRAFAELEGECKARVRRASIGEGPPKVSRAVEMRYAGQQRQVLVWLPENGGLSPDRLAAEFARAYRARYAQELPGVPVEIVSLWVRVSAGDGTSGRPQLFPLRRGAYPTVGRRRLYFGDAGWAEAPAYLWDSLEAGSKIRGPACIDDETTAVVLRPGWTGTVRHDRTLVLERD